MKKWFVLGFLFCFMDAVCQQPGIVAAEINSVPLVADTFLGYDSLGAMYSLTNNVLTKQTDTQNWQYKNPILGKITKVDLLNPLKIVVFFQNFNTVVLLDNQLNETQKINLSDNINPILPFAVGLASANRLWIYDSLSQKVGLYDYAKRDFQTLTVPFVGNVRYYESNFNYFAWTDDRGNAFRCDVYGKISALGTMPKNNQFRWVSDSILIYKKDDQLYVYDFNGNKSTFIEITKKTFKNFTYKDQILSIFTDHGITNYKITIP